MTIVRQSEVEDLDGFQIDWDQFCIPYDLGCDFVDAFVRPLQDACESEDRLTVAAIVWFMLLANAVASGEQSKRLATTAAVVRATSYRMMFRRSSGPLLGVSASRPKCGRLSADKGTREDHSSRVITQPSRRLTGQASPMRRMSGGVAVVVRGWESQPHGEGRQEVSFWMAEGFANRGGPR